MYPGYITGIIILLWDTRAINPLSSFIYLSCYHYGDAYQVYHTATGEHDSEPIDNACRADHPRQPDEQYDAEDVLHAR